MNFFDLVFYQPSLNVFYGIYLITKDVGLATIFMAFLVRLIMWPFIKKSYIVGQKTKLIQPLIKQIQLVYKGNLLGQQEVLKKLYNKYDVKPSLAGLIILLQIPIYIGLYNLINNVNNGVSLTGLYGFIFGDREINITRLAFGSVDIADRGIIVPILSVFTLIFTFLMSKYIFPQSNEAPKPKGEEKPKDDSIIDPEMFNKTLQFQMTYFLPVFSFLINLQFPAGLNIYFLAGTVFSFVQQFILSKRYKTKDLPVTEDEEIIPKALLKEAEEEKAKKTKAGDNKTQAEDSKIVEVKATEKTKSLQTSKNDNKKKNQKKKK